jgi:hypothetical protein
MPVPRNDQATKELWIISKSWVLLSKQNDY